jgi:hypothetical protein
MPSETPSASNSELDKGLPVVEPPSGKFIVQLFLLPLLIVVLIVGFWLTVRWLTGMARSPEDYLAKLDSSNDDVRWRTAQDLAQVLLRDPQLASDPQFGLALADRLHRTSQDIAAQEKPAGDASRSARSGSVPESASLESQRVYALYLSACLGNLMLPIGAPQLCQMAADSSGPDFKATARRRTQALWMLANLGQSLKRFDDLPAHRQKAILDQLQVEADGTGERGRWADATLRYLKGPEAHSLRVLGIDEALAKCAADDNPFLREVTAYALNFWEGTPAENARMEDLLVQLSRDRGRGEEILARLREGEPQDDEYLTRVPGLKIQYNATAALARRGSSRARIGVLKEMLDESLQRDNFRVKHKNGEEVPDDAAVSATVDAALQAIGELHRKDPKRDLSSLVPALDQLMDSTNYTLRNEAERARTALAK